MVTWPGQFRTHWVLGIWKITQAGLTQAGLTQAAGSPNPAAFSLKHIICALAFFELWAQVVNSTSKAEKPLSSGPLRGGSHHFLNRDLEAEGWEPGSGTYSPGFKPWLCHL